MMARLGELSAYPFYFQFTLNAYGKDFESNLPSKNDSIIPTFCGWRRLLVRNALSGVTISENTDVNGLAFEDCFNLNIAVQKFPRNSV